MRITLLAQYYHTPDCPTSARPYVLAEHLGRAHEVRVLTTREWHDKRLTREHSWAPPGVRVEMLDVPYDNRMPTRNRLRAYTAFACRALVHLCSTQRPDVIIGSSTPLSVPMAAAVAASAFRIPWVFEVRDLWPDFPVQMGAVRNRLVVQGLYAVERALYRSAHRIVALSPDMADHVSRRGASPDKLHHVQYGVDHEEIAAVSDADVRELRNELGCCDRHVVAYAGSFGRANAIPTLIATSERLRHRKDIVFVFAGDGFHAADLRAAARRDLSVRVLPPQPRRRALTLLRLASLSLVPFIDLPVLATNAPAKLPDSLACATPVIVTNDGWARRLIETSGCGWYVPPENPDMLAERIEHVLDHAPVREAAARRAVQTAARSFDRKGALQTWDRVIESLRKNGR